MTCVLDTGRYTIKTQDQTPVGLDGARVVVGTQQVSFQFRKFGPVGGVCTYVITPVDRQDHVNFNSTSQVYLGDTSQHWTVSHSGGDRYTLAPSGYGYGWKDPGAGVRPRQVTLVEAPYEQFIIRGA